MRLKLILAVALCVLMAGCATFQSAGDALKYGGKAFAESFDADAEVDKSSASVTVEGVGVSVTAGVSASKDGASVSVSGGLDWREIACILSGGLAGSLCQEQPE